MAPAPAPAKEPAKEPVSPAKQAYDTVGAADTAFGIGSLVHSAADWHAASNANRVGIGAVDNFLGRAQKPLETFYENPIIKPAEGALGSVLGGVTAINGINEMMHGQVGQGALDTTAGGLGLAGGLASMGVIGGGAVLGPASVVAGLVADGNGYAKEHGWFGQNAKGDNRDAIDWTIDGTRQDATMAHDNVRAATGSRALGDLAGLGEGIASGIGHAGAGLLIDAGAGVVDTGQHLWDAAVGVSKFENEVFTDPAKAWQDATNFGGSVANTASNMWNGGVALAGNAANAIGSGWNAFTSDPGKATGNALNAIGSGIGSVASGIGNAASGAWNAAGNVVGGFANDVGADLNDAKNGVVNTVGNVASGAMNVAGNVASGIGNAVGGLLSW